MLDKIVWNNIKDRDFMTIPATFLKRYTWGALDIYKEYDDIVGDRMKYYNTKYDLLNWTQFWVESFKQISPYKDDTLYKEIYSLSENNHKQIFEEIYSSYDHSLYNNAYDLWNAIDGYFIHKHLKNVKNVLDFGAGYGRLGLVLSTENTNYIAVDCIDHSYILQNLTLSTFGKKHFHEYFDYAVTDRKMDLSLQETNQIFHLPSWKMNLVQDNSLDLVTSCFVLPEINKYALDDFLHHSIRMLKIGGYLYVRDHEYNHIGGHTFNFEEKASKNFKLVYKCEYKDGTDIYGCPRIYQLINKNT